MIWKYIVSGQNSNQAYTSSLAIDANNNIFVTGMLYGTLLFPGNGATSYSFSSSGKFDAFVLKLSENGNYQWAKLIGSVDEDRGKALALNGNGECIISGRYEGIVDFDPGVGSYLMGQPGITNTFILKLSPDGDFVWARSSEITAAQNGVYVYSVACNSVGDLYLTGSFWGTVDFDPSELAYMFSASGGEVFLWKLDANGNFIWVKGFGEAGGGALHSAGFSVCSDNLNNVYVTGYFSEPTDFDPGLGEYVMTPYPNDQSNTFVAKLDENGLFLWAKCFLNKEWIPLADAGYSIVRDNSGGVYISGVFSGTVDFDPGSEEFLISTEPNRNSFFITKLDSYGEFLWAKDLHAITGNGLYQDYPCGLVAVNNNLNVYSSGTYIGSMDFDPSSNTYILQSTGNGIYQTPFVVKLNQTTNVVQWVGGVNTDWNTSGNWSTNVVPNSSNDVTISNAINQPIIKSGETGSCHNLTINSGSSLHISGNSISTGSLLTTGTVVNQGEFSMNRQTTDNRWQFVSTPVSGSSANVFLGDYLQTYTEATDTWSDIVDPNAPLLPLKGYSLWGIGKSTSRSFQGTPNTGEVSIPFSFSPSSNTLHTGFNLLGNPYPSSIDWDLLNEQYGAVYYFDGTTYKSWNGVGNGSRYIPPMQGFMIAPGFNGTLTLNDSYRTHLGRDLYYKTAGNESNEVVLIAGNNTYMDELFIDFNDLATPAFDLAFDAWKLFSTKQDVPQIYSIIDEGKLSIDQRPSCSNIPFGFSCTAAGDYEIGVKKNNSGVKLFLEDRLINMVVDISSSSYHFSYIPNEMDDRFVIHMSNVGLNNVLTNDDQVRVKTEKNEISVDSDISHIKTIQVFDQLGKVVYSLNCDELNLSLKVNVNTGIYYVKVTTTDSVKSFKVYIQN
ncbi:MAG: T9SS type A sorting domain-containing protein [Sphingobacteriia bacterium]|nr:T9SS type A sorting domain-containing protein [Sphingobacteriia bacterium]